MASRVRFAQLRTHDLVAEKSRLQIAVFWVRAWRHLAVVINALYREVLPWAHLGMRDE